MQRIVTILDTALTVNYNDRPISTQKDLDTYKFEFDDSWLGYVKTAVFYTDPMMVRHVVLLEDNIATIPWEILTGKPQVLYIGVFGTKDTKVKPTTFGAVRLREGSYIDGIAPLPPTPDVYQQIIGAWEGAKEDETIRVANENSRKNSFDALVADYEQFKTEKDTSFDGLVIEYNALKVALEQEITDGTASVDALQVLESQYAAKALALETTYAPELNLVKSQLAETQTQFQQVIANATVDSEVINARNSTVKGKVYATLDERLEEIESNARGIYGVRRTLNATSPVLTRIYDSVGKVANVPLDDSVVQNDFDNIYPWSHIKECKRDTVGRIHYKGDTGYDAVIGDWLVEIPKFYIKMERTATTFDRLISSAKHIGFWTPQAFKSNGIECDKIYVGRFKTGIVDGVNVSRPGIFPENFRDLASFRTGARAKGAGWQLIDISYKTEVLDMLYIIESATLNSQVYLGNGITTVRYAATDLARIAETAVNRIVVTNAMAGNYNVGENICIGTAQGSENIARDRTILSKAALPDGVNTEIVFDGDPVNIAVGNVLWQGAQKNGQTMNLQKPNGKLSGVSGRTSNKYRGMEDIFGNVFEWVDGVLISERIAQICKDPAKYASTLTADYKPVGYTNLATDGYPLEMGFDSNFPEAIFPTTTGGGTSTGYCDYYYQNTGLRGAFFGGHASHGILAGVFFWYLSSTPTPALWYFGSRLLFKPPV